MPRIKAAKELSRDGNRVVCQVTVEMPAPYANLTSTSEAIHTVTAHRWARVFKLLRDATRLADDELLRTFNMGIGFCLVLDARSAADAAAQLRVSGEKVFEIGDIVPGSGAVRYE